jgi:phage terminase small subunit
MEKDKKDFGSGEYPNTGRYYPAKKGQTYSWGKNWRIFCTEITQRDNFKESHLKTVEILCDLLEEYEKLTLFVKENGYSFKGPEGPKPFPEVSIRNKISQNIVQYCKLLDIKLSKDKPNASEEEENEWDETNFVAPPTISANSTLC